MRVLVGDIGGTKTRLAVAETIGDKVQLDHERHYPSRDYGSLDALLRRYCDDTGAQCDLAALAIAGPVKDGCSRATNLPWEVDALAIRQGLSLSAVRLLNDLEAVAWGVSALGSDEVAVIHPGDPDAVGNACVVAAGTGLGQAGLFWDGQRHHPFATEGGHTDFSPTDEREFALFQFLQRKHGHVSWERILSGRADQSPSLNAPASPFPWSTQTAWLISASASTYRTWAGPARGSSAGTTARPARSSSAFGRAKAEVDRSTWSTRVRPRRPARSRMGPSFRVKKTLRYSR